MRCVILLFLAVLNIMGWAGAAGAQPVRTSLSLSPAFFTGSFGSSSTTNVYALPLTLRVDGANWRISLEVPGLVLSGNGLVNGGTVIAGGGQRVTRAGIGDIWTQAAVRVSQGQGWRPALWPYVRLKIPTASRAAGFGTGAADAVFGMRASWQEGPFYPFLRVGYWITGKAPGLNLRNAPLLEAGSSWRMRPRTYVTLAYYYAGPLQWGGSNQQTLLAACLFAVTPRLSVQLFAQRGLSSGSAAFGAGLGATIRF